MLLVTFAKLNSLKILDSSINGMDKKRRNNYYLSFTHIKCSNFHFKKFSLGYLTAVNDVKIHKYWALLILDA